MNTLSGKRKSKGLTLIELLVIICVIATLAAIIFPTTGGKWKAQQINCGINLKNIDESFVAWSQTHDGKLPMQVDSTEGGTSNFVESGSALVHFLVLTNSDLTFVHHDIVGYSQEGTNYQRINSYTNYGIEPRCLACPSDEKRDSIYLKKTVSEFTDTNISYFVGVDATLNNPKSILAGDRHLEINVSPTKPGLLKLTKKTSVGWSDELHYSKSTSTAGGNILLADGHVEFFNSKKFNAVFQSQSFATNLFAIP